MRREVLEICLGISMNSDYLAINLNIIIEYHLFLGRKREVWVSFGVVSVILELFVFDFWRNNGGDCF